MNEVLTCCLACKEKFTGQFLDLTCVLIVLSQLCFVYIYVGKFFGFEGNSAKQGQAKILRWAEEYCLYFSISSAGNLQLSI